MTYQLNVQWRSLRINIKRQWRNGGNGVNGGVAWQWRKHQWQWRQHLAESLVVTFGGNNDISSVIVTLAASSCISMA